MSLKLNFDYFGRGDRIRTCDLRFWRPPLYQLSYSPMCRVNATEQRYHTAKCKLCHSRIYNRVVALSIECYGKDMIDIMSYPPEILPYPLQDPESGVYPTSTDGNILHAAAVSMGNRLVALRLVSAVDAVRAYAPIEPYVTYTSQPPDQASISLDTPPITIGPHHIDELLGLTVPLGIQWDYEASSTGHRFIVREASQPVTIVFPGLFQPEMLETSRLTLMLAALRALATQSMIAQG